MPTKIDKKKRRGKIFIIALAALIFAETGYLLGTTGLGGIIFGLGGSSGVSFDAVLSVSDAVVFFNGSVTRGRPVSYGDAYVYVVAYAPGVALPSAVVRGITFDAAEKPVYVLPIPQHGGVIAPQDFVDVLPDNAKNPVILLTYSPDKLTTVESWLRGINLPQSYYIRVELRNGKPVSVVAVA